MASAFVDRELRFYDAGAYIVTAKAMATGLGYRNPNLPGDPPQGLYPPVVPLLAAAVWRLQPAFPDNLAIMRAATIAFGVLFLAVARAVLLRVTSLSGWEATSVIALIGFHPTFLDFTTDVTSEIPYALVSCVALYAYVRFVDGRRARWCWAMVICVSLAVLTRTIGVALVLALSADAVWRRRPLLALGIAAAGLVAFVPWSIWSWHARTAYAGFPPEIAANYRGYVANLASTHWLTTLHRALLVNAMEFVLSWASFVLPWAPGILGIVAIILFAGTIGFRSFQQPRVHVLYCLAAAAMIVLWPWPLNRRFVLVLSPFLTGVWLEGVKNSIGRLRSRRLSPAAASTAAFAAIVASAIAANATELVVGVRSRTESSPMLQQFHETAEWMKATTPADAVFVAPSDPAYYLFTNRKTVRLAYPDPFDVFYAPVHPARFSHPETTLGWFREIRACYFIQDVLSGAVESQYFADLLGSLQRAPSGSMARVHASADGSFVVFKLVDCER